MQRRSRKSPVARINVLRAKQSCNQSRRRTKTMRGIVEVDRTLFNSVLSSRATAALQRPSLITMIDHQSRSLIGFSISLDQSAAMPASLRKLVRRGTWQRRKGRAS